MFLSHSFPEMFFPGKFSHHDFLGGQNIYYNQITIMYLNFMIRNMANEGKIARDLGPHSPWGFCARRKGFDLTICQEQKLELRSIFAMKFYPLYIRLD